MTGHLEVTLASLLHDVGKFGQRAHPSGKGLSPEAENLRDYLCPFAPRGYHTHVHAVYTAEFILHHLGRLPAGMDPERVLRLSAYHHRPSADELDQKIIAQADHLSSGMEREADEEGQAGREAFRRVRLRAITNEVRLGQRQPGHWSLALEPLRPAAAFPVLEPEARPRPDHPLRQPVGGASRGVGR